MSAAVNTAGVVSLGCIRELLLPGNQDGRGGVGGGTCGAAENSTSGNGLPMLFPYRY